MCAYNTFILTVQDSTGHIGFQFKEGKIHSIAVDSSAARNGLLVDHNLLEVLGEKILHVLPVPSLSNMHYTKFSKMKRENTSGSKALNVIAYLLAPNV